MWSYKLTWIIKQNKILNMHVSKKKNALPLIWLMTRNVSLFLKSLALFYHKGPDTHLLSVAFLFFSLWYTFIPFSTVCPHLCQEVALLFSFVILYLHQQLIDLLTTRDERTWDLLALLRWLFAGGRVKVGQEEKPSHPASSTRGTNNMHVVLPSKPTGLSYILPSELAACV